MKRAIIIFGISLFSNIALISVSFSMETLKKEMEESQEMARYYAAEALGKIGNKKAVKPLIDVLNDKDPYVRRFSIWALGKIGDKRAIEPLRTKLWDYCLENRLEAALALEKLDWVPKNRRERLYLHWAKNEWAEIEEIDFLILELKDINSAVRRGAAEVLTKIKIDNKKVLFPLISSLNDIDWGVPIYAVEALGKTTDVRAVKSLIKASEHHDSRVREKAVEALGKIGDIRAIESLVKRLIQDGDWDIKKEAAFALERLGWKPKNDEEKITFLLAKKDWDEIKKTNLIENLILIVKSKEMDRWEKRKIVDILGEMGDKRAVEPLIELMRTTRNYWEPVIALGKLKDSRAVESLLEALRDKGIKDGDQGRIVEALGEIGDLRAIPVLIELLNNHNTNITIIKALGKLNAKEAIEPLANILIPQEGTREKEWGVQSIAALTLEKLAWRPRDGKEEKYFLFAKAIDVKYIEGSRKMELTKEEDILEKIKDKKVIIYFFKNEDWNTRKRAIEITGLLKMRDKDLIEYLIRALGDEESNIRKSAAWALSEINDKKGIEAMRGSLKDSAVTAIVAEALVKIKDKKIIKFLLEELKKMNSLHSYEAYSFLSYAEIVRLLGETDDAQVIEPLIKILKTKPRDIDYFSEW